ncbi:MAG: hypothetical protein V1698_01315 [bacterium]
MMKGLNLWAAVFLILGGAVHTFPQLYRWLTDLTGGVAWVQIVVGVISVIIGLITLLGEQQIS